MIKYHAYEGFEVDDAVVNLVACLCYFTIEEPVLDFCVNSMPELGWEGFIIESLEVK